MEENNLMMSCHAKHDMMHECANLRLGDIAPDFEAVSTYGPIKMSDCRGRWVVLFSHPGDFTPICTTEFLSFATLFPEFSKRNAQLIGLSIDSNSSHLAWVNNIYRNTGVTIPFPVIADRDMSIAKKYGMIAPKISDSSTVRCVFIICPEQKIRAILTYPQTNGRNTYEILRLLDALQLSDANNVLTPVNWVPNQPVVIPPPKTYAELTERIKNCDGYNCMDWYLCYKPLNVREPQKQNDNCCCNRFDELETDQIPTSNLDRNVLINKPNLDEMKDYDIDIDIREKKI